MRIPQESTTEEVEEEPTEEETTVYETKTLTIETVYIYSYVEYPEGIESITFAEGIKYLNSWNSILNTVQKVTLPDSLESFYGTIHGARKLQSDGLSYPDPDVAQWVKDLAEASEDHIAYVGKSALWVSPEYESTTLTFKEGITNILDFAAMGNENITSAIIPDEISDLGDGLLLNCTKLETATLSGERFKKIPYLMFAKSGIKSLEISENFAAIGAYAFYGTESLKDLTFAENSQCKMIDYRAFMGTALEKITIPKKVSILMGEAFRNATALKQITFEEESQCSQISFSAFKNCSSLESFTLPDNVTLIEGLAFMGCTKLKEFQISPQSKLQKISDGAFGWLFYKAKDDNTGANANIPYSWQAYSLDDSITMTSQLYPLTEPSAYGCPIEEIFIPSAVYKGDYSYTMGAGLFAGNTALKKVVFQKAEDQATHMIPYKAFYGCTSLEEVQLNGNATHIQSYAFYSCSNLKNIDLTGVTKIEYETFDGTGLTEITIPSSVTSLGMRSLVNCKDLNKITIASTLSGQDTSDSKLFNVIGQNTADSNSPYINPYREYEQSKHQIFSNAEYRAVYPNATAPKIIEVQAVDGESILDRESSNSQGGFLQYMAMVEELIVGDGVKKIGNYDCASCVSLKKITLPTSLESIGDYAFYHAIQLTGIDFTKLTNLKSIGNRAFFLLSVNADSTTNSGILMEQADLKEGYGLQEIILPENVTIIYDSAFWGQRNVKKIVIKGKTTTIVESAFKFCNQLEEVEVETSALGNYPWNSLFWNDRQKTLKKVTISGDAFLLLDEEAETLSDTLYGLQMKELILNSDKMSCLQNGLAKECSKLQKVELGEKIKQINPVAFYFCENLKSITLPETVETLDIAAFAKSGLEKIVILNKNMTIKEAVYTVSDPEKETSYENLFNGANLKSAVAIPRDVTIYGYQESTAHDYAKAHGNAFVALDGGVLPGTEMAVENIVKTVGEVQGLPEGWSWKAEDAEKELTADGSVEATAEYTSEFAQYYTTNEVCVTITRKACEPAEEILFTGEGEYAPKCTETGLGHKECSLCGDVVEMNITVEATGHSMEHHDANEASCIQSGTAEYWTCESCHQMFADEAGTRVIDVKDLVVDKMNHEPKTVVENQTDTSYDLAVYCKHCETPLSSETIKRSVPETEMNVDNTLKTVGIVKGLPEGWNWKTEDVDAKLTAGENTTATAVYTADDAEHYTKNEVRVTITRKACEAEKEILFTGAGEYAPSCTKDGLGHKECSLCGDVIEANVTAAATGHAMVHHDAKEASCIKYGAAEYWTCEDCHQMFADEAGTKTIEVTELVTDKKKHEPNTAVKENQTDKTYDLVVYCKHCAEEISRKTVTVTVEVTNLTLDKEQVTLGVGESCTVVATIAPANATDKSLTYTSGNPSVATVENGKIKAKKKGTAVITVTASNQKKVTMKVTVKNKPKKVTLNVKKKSLKKGAVFTLKAKLSKGSASYNMTWKSSNVKVATVDANGKVKALKKGKAKITVKTANGKKAVCSITVK